MASFFTPIINPYHINGVRFSTIGNFAEKYCAWSDKSYRIIKGYQNKHGQNIKFEMKEINKCPQLSTAWRLTKLTLIFPILMMGVKTLYRMSNKFVIDPKTQQKPLNNFLKPLTQTINVKQPNTKPHEKVLNPQKP